MSGVLPIIIRRLSRCKFVPELNRELPVLVRLVPFYVEEVRRVRREACCVNCILIVRCLYECSYELSVFDKCRVVVVRIYACM